MFRVPVVDFYVTGACNLGCPYCFGELDVRPGMKRETFRRALGFARVVGASTIELCGGEPLLYRDLDWAVEFAGGEGLGLILRTNALLAPARREFIARNFQAVGISLDGDAETNDLMRPLKGGRRVDPQAKFEIPFREVTALKELNPRLRILLATVATAENLGGVRRLADVLAARRPPLDLWKVHQFVSNNFRSLETRNRFTVSKEAFAALEADLTRQIGGAFPLSCRRSNEVDGSCLVVTQGGEVRVGALVFGVLDQDPFAEIAERLDAFEASVRIQDNKNSTYADAVHT